MLAPDVTGETTDRGLGGRLWAVPLLILAAGTAAAWIFDLDLAISRRFYVPDAPMRWPFEKTALAQLVDHWGRVPAVALGIGACVMAALGARRRRRDLLRAGLIVALALVLGPLLLANGVLKPVFGRPRPKEIAEFGGADRFRPVLKPTFDPKQGSFPSGHAAAGFALVLPFFVLRRTRRRLAGEFLLLGLAYGSLMGAVRIADGRHFFTDALWAGGVVWFSGYAATALVERVLPLEAQLPTVGLPDVRNV